MSKIKIFTPKKHRWGSKIQTLFGIFSFDGEGFSEIENSKEKEFNDYLTEIGIEIIEKVKKPTKKEIEESKNTAIGVSHLKDDITGGKSGPWGKGEDEPKEVIEKTIEVEEVVVEEPKVEVKKELTPLEEIKKDLEKTKYKELHKLAKEMKLPEEEWKKLRKVDLINYLAPKI